MGMAILRTHGKLAKPLPSWVILKRNGKTLLRSQMECLWTIDGNQQTCFLFPDGHSLRLLPAEISHRDQLTPPVLSLMNTRGARLVVVLIEPHPNSISLYIVYVCPFSILPTPSQGSRTQAVGATCYMTSCSWSTMGCPYCLGGTICSVSIMCVLSSLLLFICFPTSCNPGWTGPHYAVQLTSEFTRVSLRYQELQAHTTDLVNLVNLSFVIIASAMNLVLIPQILGERSPTQIIMAQLIKASN